MSKILIIGKTEKGDKEVRKINNLYEFIMEYGNFNIEYIAGFSVHNYLNSGMTNELYFKRSNMALNELQGLIDENEYDAIFCPEYKIEDIKELRYDNNNYTELCMG